MIKFEPPTCESRWFLYGMKSQRVAQQFLIMLRNKWREMITFVQLLLVSFIG